MNEAKPTQPQAASPTEGGAMMDERPSQLPERQWNGEPLKPITHLLLERRATSHFKPDPIPEAILDAVLRLGLQAPSGYNIQPWRFLVVRDASSRQRLQKVAFNQAKVGEAPVVIIAFGMKEEWKTQLGEALREGARRGFGKLEKLEEQRQGALGFLSGLPAGLWLNRHTMIAFTTLMLVAEAYGLDTAPMEGFDAAGVKREFGLPEEAEVVALLALGHAQPPDKPYTGRFPLQRLVYLDRYGQPWPGGKK